VKRTPRLLPFPPLSLHGFPRLPSSPLPRRRHRQPQRASCSAPPRPSAAARFPSPLLRFGALPACPLQRRTLEPARCRAGLLSSWCSWTSPIIEDIVRPQGFLLEIFTATYNSRNCLGIHVALVARALIENPQLINWWLVFKAFYGLVALICGNGYIVGINQIYDIRIDKVNKPYLPIAAGDLSVQTAWLLVVLFAAAGFSIVVTNFGPFITSLYCLGLFLGTIYSVPPFRLKRYPVAAFLIIATVRGFLLNFGVYYATRAALGLTFQWSSPVAFITCFVTLFALVIAITKDLPDVEGDRKYQISTLATKLGVRNIAFLGSGLLIANYVAAIAVAFLMPQAFRRTVMVPVHAALAVGIIFQTWVLEQAKYTKDAISQYYRFIWNLFYAEYIFFPLI
ncbi:hypothetical protein EE612_040248, partial [Oryza sativa]